MNGLTGTALADRMRPELARRAAAFEAQHQRRPTMAVVAADDPVSVRFVQLKQQRFRETGLELRPVRLRPHAETALVLEQVRALNEDPAMDAIFLQFPLPPLIDGQAAGDAIALRKDIDCAGSGNLGRLLGGDPRFTPAAPAAVLALLEDSLEELHGRSVVVVGADHVVERCVMLLALTRGATVCRLDPGDHALMDAAAGADAVVITGALPPGDMLRHVRHGAVLLDAAYFLPRRPAGWLSERALDHLGVYLPQYGNVGPLTVALLMESTLAAAG